MKLILRILVILSVIFAMMQIFIGLAEIIGVQKYIIADSWNYTIKEMGVTDPDLSYKIAKRLASDKSNYGEFHCISGTLLLLVSGMLLKFINNKNVQQNND